jgi:hypothetical protein
MKYKQFDHIVQITSENRDINLKRAIQEGLDSGIAEDFNPDGYLKKLKSEKKNHNHQK